MAIMGPTDKQLKQRAARNLLSRAQGKGIVFWVDNGDLYVDFRKYQDTSNQNYTHYQAFVNNVLLEVRDLTEELYHAVKEGIDDYVGKTVHRFEVVVGGEGSD